MVAKNYAPISNGESGGSIRPKLNDLGTDAEISVRIVSAFANIEAEIEYFKDTNTIVYALSENKYYNYNGTIWVEYTGLPIRIDLDDYLLLAGGTMTGNIDLDDNALLNVNYIDFDLVNGIAATEGRMVWNPDDGTLNLGMPGGVVNLQIGQENHIRATNDEAVQVDNGKAVYISGGSGNFPKVKLASNDSFSTFGVVGIATENITASQKGYITTFGYVREMDTSAVGFAPGVIAWLDTNGDLTPTRPVSPIFQVGVGVVIKAHASEGILFVNPYIIPRLSGLTDVTASSIADEEGLFWNSSNSRWENKAMTANVPISLEVYDAEPARASVSDVHGGLLSLATGQPLNASPTNIVVSEGIGKLIIVVNAGSDIDGEITITGESIDRETGASTPGDTDIITVDALTTDGSDTDGNGNTRYSLSGAYISSKWFTGSITISTTDLTLTDVDVYHCSFEQFNDSPNIMLETFDVNLLATHIAAQFDAYLYLIEVTGSKVYLSRESSLNLGTDGETPIANKYYRLRRGNLNKTLDGTTDGIFVEIYYENNPSYIEDMNMKIWATKSVQLTLT